MVLVCLEALLVRSHSLPLQLQTTAVFNSSKSWTSFWSRFFSSQRYSSNGIERKKNILNKNFFCQCLGDGHQPNSQSQGLRYQSLGSVAHKSIIHPLRDRLFMLFHVASFRTFVLKVPRPKMIHLWSFLEWLSFCKTEVFSKPRNPRTHGDVSSASRHDLPVKSDVTTTLEETKIEATWKAVGALFLRQ